MKSVPRPRRVALIEEVLRRSPVCALLGPRQSGKTTLAREIAAHHPGTTFFDLETAAGREALEQPELALGPLRGLVVIDEIQRLPRLFETLRPLADRGGAPARFLVLGSASPTVVRGVSESLAGRIGFVDLTGFDLEEAGADRWRDLWIRGGFPPSFLARSVADSLEWRRDFLRTFLERDLPALGVRTPAEALRRFWTMLAHYHGQTLNVADLGRGLGIRAETVRRHLDLLVGTYAVRLLPPWHENLSKRQVRAPKVYLRDSGILHLLHGIGGWEGLLGHPKRGASWEGFALEQVIGSRRDADACFWATHGGAELDLLLLAGGRRIGVEFKFADAPSMTRSLHAAMEDLRLDEAWLVHPGTGRYRVHEKAEAIPLAEALVVLGEDGGGRRPVRGP